MTTRELTEGKVRKGGVNRGPSQVKKRPPPPPPIKIGDKRKGPVTAEEVIKWIDHYMSEGFITLNGVALPAARYVIEEAVRNITK